MDFLRSNTAVIVAVGPFYDKTDGVTIETALTITNEKITLVAETDAGSAPTLVLDNVTGATSGTANDLNYITNGDNGMMQLELAAADVNRVGRMKLSITDAANHVPVFHEYFVLPQAIFDWLTGVIVPLPANVTQLLGTAWLSPAVAGTPDVNTKTLTANAITATAINADAITAAKIADGAIDAATFAAGAINAAAIATDAITAAKIAADAIGASELAADAVTEIQSGLATAAALTTVDDFLDTEIADIQARLPAALTANGNIKADALRVGGTVQTGGDLAALITVVDDFIDTEVAAILAAVDTEVAAILALLDDPRGEPAQGAPAVNPDLATKIDFLYKSWRNLKTNDGSTTKLFADDGTTVDHKQTTSEAGGTVSKSEWVTGP